MVDLVKSRATFLGRFGTWFLAVVCVIAGSGVAVSSAQGEARLDKSFGDAGTVIHTFDNLSPAFDAAEDRFGRLVVIGWVRRDGGNYLLRLRPNGTADPTFGNLGGAVFYPDKFPKAQSLTIDHRGRILTAAGPAIYGPRSACVMVTRWPADGSLPEWRAFRGGRPPLSRSTAMICEFKNHFAFVGLHGLDVALTKSGKVLVSGTYYASARRQGGMVTRLMPNGNLDKTLRGDKRTQTIRKGVVKILPERGHDGSFTDIRPMAGGKFLVGGFLSGKFMAARFQQDGSLDRTFGKNGVSTFDLDGDSKCECSFGRAMVRDYHGRILITGVTYDPESDDPVANKFKLIRLLPNGRLDRKFGNSGIATLPKNVDARVRAIAVQRNGRIVVAGAFDRQFALARFNPDGTPDKSFFDDGIYADWVMGNWGSAWDVIIDHKGRIVAAGGTESSHFAIRRFLPR